MTIRKKTVAGLLLASTVFLLTVLIICLVSGENRFRLILESRETGQTVQEWTVSPGDTVKLSFTMSIYKCPQSEVFTVSKDGRLYLEENAISLYEAAQYYSWDNAFTLGEDGWFHAPIGQYMDRVDFPMGFVANHHVDVRDSVFYVSEVAHGGERMTLRITPRE